ncbi:MAG: dTMP kinase [Acidithiobacillus sp.]
MPPRHNRAFFLTLEGIEGAGKSSAVSFIANWLEERGYAVEVTREPGGSPLGEALRPIFLNPELAIAADSELLLLYAARREHLYEKILPALAQGRVLLCDRYEDSTYAYQGGGRGVSFARIHALSVWAGIRRQPDLTFWLDISPDLGRQRTLSRHPDRVEREDSAFFHRARAVFAQRWREDPARIIRIDAELPLDLVHGQIAQRLAEALGCG